MSVMTPRREASLYREDNAAVLEMPGSPRNVYFGYLAQEANVSGLLRLGSMKRSFFFSKDRPKPRLEATSVKCDGSGIKPYWDLKALKEQRQPMIIPK